MSWYRGSVPCCPAVTKLSAGQLPKEVTGFVLSNTYRVTPFCPVCTQLFCHLEHRSEQSNKASTLATQLNSIGNRIV